MLEIRLSRPDEEGRQRELWRTAFGDGEAAIDAFYRCCCPPEDMLVLAEDGVIAAMLALLPMELAAPGGERAPAWYVYALTTGPAMRNRGFGRRLLRGAGDYLRERRAGCLTVVPAEPSLHRYFGTAGFQPCFAHRELDFTAETLPRIRPGDRLETVGAADYNRIREGRLEGIHRACFGGGLIRYQQALSELSGAALCRITVGGETGCAAVERTEEGGLLCKELLISPDAVGRAAALTADRFQAGFCRVRTPASLEGPPGGTLRPFGMIKWYNREQGALWAGVTRGYMGLGFD